LVVLLAKVLEKFIKTATLGWLNKVAGIIFGVFKMAFFISVLFWLMQMVETKLPLLNETQKNTSVLYAPVARIAPAVLPVIKGGYKQLQDKIKEGSNF
jgi:membrane protein required for colicin V production